MKTIARPIVLFFTIIIITILCLEAGASSILRLHVIANSDSGVDQRVKLLVRDAVLELEQSALKDCSNSSEAKAAIMEAGKNILAKANETLHANAMDYGVQLEIGEFYFPERRYGNEIYREDKYEALRIILGDGQGKNWWCVMFPLLCNIDADTTDTTGKLRFKSIIGEWFGL